MPSKEVARRGKICIVPVCKAVSADVPDRIFFAVPENKKEIWLRKVGGDITSIKPNKRLFCCENHFDVKKDIVGYDFYKLFGGRIKLEDHAYPFKNLGDIIVPPPKRLPITIEQLPRAKKVPKEEPRDESVDPLSIPDDEKICDDDHDGFACTNSDSDNDTEHIQANSSHVGRSEEIVVIPEVYINDAELEPVNGVDVLSNIKSESDFSPDPFDNVKKEETEFYHADDNADGSTTDSKFNCLKCGSNYTSARSLKRHEQSVHRKKRNQKSLRCKPKVEVDENKTIACTECAERFSTNEELLRHKIVHKKSFDCDVCHKTFQSRFRLKVHYPMHMEVKPYLCEICSRPFARATNLRRHRYTHVTEKKYICDSCGKGFPAKFLLRLHMTKAHTEAATVMCSQCSRIFSSTTHLKVHVNVYHSAVNPYKCEVCKLQFNQPSALLRHRKRFHDPNSSFHCQECPKKFTQQFELERHMKTHPIKRSIIRCEDCGITLCRADRLKAHRLKLHNPEYPFQCVTCRQTFQTEILLTQHVTRLHAPEYEYVYKCLLCPKKFNQEAALKRHVKLHTDMKKSVRCELCETILGRVERLKAHMRALHNPNYPFKCDTCRQTFKEQKLLDSHIVQAHKQTILCEYCNKAFGKRDGLRRHLRRIHSEFLSDQMN
ncbi:Zinc finger protein [Pseudolycoriella hygida]|uniref:Zinc finger protein n=1 Tax=Pseudolycoriella hygida TaxID=35572 RepID=A0A9Q0N842_9DIPT|nr:Zinc finger protein [Pseudolycoriella hygida]